MLGKVTFHQVGAGGIGIQIKRKVGTRKSVESKLEGRIRIAILVVRQMQQVDKRGGGQMRVRALYSPQLMGSRDEGKYFRKSAEVRGIRK